MLTWDLQQFLLIRKTHPEWMKGKLNGIGGKIEKKEELLIDPDDPGKNTWLMETPPEAMIREFYEETGITTTRQRWHCFHIESFFHGPDDKANTKVYYFAAFGDEAKRQCLGDNKDPLFEQVDSFKLVDFLLDEHEYIYNLPYLLQMIIVNVKRNTFKQLNPEGVNNIP
jgi:8-oxo-dGTP pyrophosphatase MutT (NUDIX family)